MIFIKALVKVDSVFIYGSHRGISRLSVMLVPLIRLFKRKCVIKITGGNFWEYYLESGALWRYTLAKTLFSQHVLLETHYQVDRFSKQYNGVSWFPMTRDLIELSSDMNKESEVVSNSDNNVGQPLKVAFFGHIRKTKGVPELIDASKELQDIEIDAYGQFIGLDESVFADGLVNYKGVVQPDEVFSTMRQYDVLVLPTYYPGEGYPGVIIEAKKAGLAVVSTEWRSIPEIVNDGTDGILIATKNSMALASVLRRLNHNRELLASMKAESAQSFAKFDTQLWGEKLVEYLR